MFDSGIARMGIFAFVFLIAFAGLMSLIPSGLNANLPDYMNKADSIPKVWNGIDIIPFNFSDYYNITLDYATYTVDTFDIGGRNLKLEYNFDIGVNYLELFHRYGIGLLFSEAMDWYYKGVMVSYQYFGKATINSYIIDNATISNSSTFNIQCLGLGSGSSAFWVTSIFSFNKTKYDNPTEAWQNSELEMFIGINPSNSNYSKDIMYMVTQLLGFNTIAVFGTNEPYAIVLNGIICAVIYGAIVIFSGAIVLELLPNWL